MKPNNPHHRPLNRPPRSPPPLTRTFSTHLIVPYFITASGEIKRPEHLIAWWTRIFSFYVPDEKDHIELRFLCRLYRDSLKPPPLYATYPHPNYPTLNGLMDALNSVFEKDPSKAPKIVFVTKGTFYIPVTKELLPSQYSDEEDQNDVTIGYPMKMIGAGQDKTTIHGGFAIKGQNEDGKIVTVQDMTMKGSSGCGLDGDNGLSFVCDSITFTQCKSAGVYAMNTTGRLINCVITHCAESGIYCDEKALIELEGSQTTVQGNCASEDSVGYGLEAFYTSSIIHLLSPLTKESVSTNNGGSGNFNCGTNDDGTIQTVDSFDQSS